jgi:uncharacterized protein (TIGR02217 family)
MDVVLNDYIDWLQTGPLRKTFEWATDVVPLDGFHEQRNILLEQPRRHWFLNWNILPLNNREKLLSLFNRARGRGYTYLYTDLDDYECAESECSITAIAAQTNFQLIKTYEDGFMEEWDENKSDIVPGSSFPPIVKVDTVTQTEGVDYTLDDATGIVIFGTAPGAGAVVTANYQFYFRVRFEKDEVLDTLVAPEVYTSRDLRMIEVFE